MFELKNDERRETMNESEQVKRLKRKKKILLQDLRLVIQIGNNCI